MEDLPPQSTEELEPDPAEFIEQDLTDNGLAEANPRSSDPTGV
jgi:hypothetical protein